MKSRIPILALVLALPAVLRAAPWVVISEIHYHPPQGDALQFVEIFHQDAPRVDLSGWSLEGTISFHFPPGTVLLPGESLVVAREPAALRAQYRALDGTLDRALGPFTGALGHRDGQLRLRNAAGALVCEVRYRNRGRWPAEPGGTGHTLSLRDPALDPETPQSWAASREPGGTPGASNGFSAAGEERGLLLIRRGEEWSYFRGQRPPRPGWKALAFDDSSWEIGPSGLGFGDGDDATVIEGMRGSYLSLFARRTFTVKGLPPGGRLILRINFDDGFAASLNGAEIARANLGPPGTEVPYHAPATATHESGSPVEYDLGPASSWLREGKNVLAIQVHNRSIGSSDLTLVPELELRGSAAGRRKQPPPRINEVFAGAEPESFVEIFNPGSEAVSLDGCFLSDDPANLRKLALPAAGSFHKGRVGPRGFLVLRSEGLELRPTGGGEIFLALFSAAENRVLDALRIAPPAGRGGATALAQGRHPDGEPVTDLGVPTPGAPNRVGAASDLVINEIHYHPPSSESLEFVEILNRGKEAVVLDGFRLRGGIRYDFPSGRSLASGDLLVVARDPAALAAGYGLDPGRVEGPFQGALSNSGDEVALVDPRGLTAASVHYGDRDPWPRRGDGRGSSLELLDPDLDSSLAAAWAPSDERARSRWQVLSYQQECRPSGRQLFPDLQFLLLDEGECLIDDVEVREVGPAGGVLLSEDFEAGGAGWIGLGNHQASGIHHQEGGGKCFRIAASGRGNTHENLVLFPNLEGLQPGLRCQVSFRVRWQGGSPLLLTRVGGNALARRHRLEASPRPGTPLAENSVRGERPRPAVGTPVQDPIAPSELEPVTVTVRLSARGGVREASIRYRRDGEPEWRAAPLDDAGTGADALAGDGNWSGKLPPLPAGLVEFFIEARDAAGARGAFPVDAPARTALYAVGLKIPRGHPGYTLLATEQQFSDLQSGPRLSNVLRDGTFVFGDSRIFYNVGFRSRGSPWTRSHSNNWKIVFGAETLDGRRSLVLDRQGGSLRPGERLVYWLIDSLRAPTPRQRYVHFQVFGREEGLCEDVEEIDGRLLARWTGATGPAAEPAPLFKVDDFIELSGDSMRVRQRATLHYGTGDPEEYRWNFSPRAGEDFGPLLRLLELFDPRRTPDEKFLEQAEEVADLDEWLRVLAARTLAGDWDTLGRRGGKNAWLYRSPRDRRWLLVPWDCDQATLRFPPTDTIFFPEHPALDRVARLPRYQRAYLGHLEYLARRKLAPEILGTILDDLRGRARVPVDQVRRFLEARRDYVLEQIPAVPFRVVEARRLVARDRADRLRIRGEGPPLVQRIRLGDRESAARGTGVETWEAEFPVGPEGGDFAVEALDLGGGVVARAVIAVEARAGALPPGAGAGGRVRAGE